MSKLVEVSIFCFLLAFGIVNCEISPAEDVAEMTAMSAPSEAVSAQKPAANDVPFLTDVCGFKTYSATTALVYDLTSLRGKSLHVRDYAGVYDYYLNICGVAPECKDENAMACRVGPNNSSYTLAYLNERPSWTTYGDGVQLTVRGQSLPAECVSGYPPSTARSATVLVSCSPYNWPAPSLTPVVVQDPATCGISFYILHASGCQLTFRNSNYPYPSYPSYTSYPSYSINSGWDTRDKVRFAAAISGITVFVLLILSLTVFVIRRRCCKDGCKYGSWRRGPQTEGALSNSFLPMSAPAVFHETNADAPAI